MVTLRDVALAAGVSPAAASYALSGSSKVTEETAARVRKAAEELHYTGNLAAKALRQGKSGIIGVAVFELSREYPATLSYVISTQALKHGMQALIQQISYSTKQERAFLRSMSNQYSDGMILCSAGVPESEIAMLSKGRPAVILDDAAVTSYDTVLNPREEGMRALIGHLFSTGKSDPLIIGAKPRTKKDAMAGASGNDRLLTGCYEGFADNGHRLTKSRIVPLQAWDIEIARLKAHELVEQHRILDSAICATDTVALGFMRGLIECGVRVPEDVAVVGFDGINTARYGSPSLTTIEVDMEEIASRAVELLMNRINAPEDADHTPQHVTVGYRLRVGESTVGRQ